MPADSTCPPKKVLLANLREQAQERGLLKPDVDVSPDHVFSLVRDMDYQRASSREPQATISEWRGTCSGKHYLLKALFEEMDYQVKVVMCPHWFTQENTGGFPDNLKVLLTKGPVPDVHTFLRVNAGGSWIQMDATWPLWAEPLGLTVNHRFQPGMDMELACEPAECFEVPAGEDPQRFKETLIKSFCGPNSSTRERFIQEMSNWLAQYRPVNDR
ncbi:MAG: hypothetical protein BZY80_02435 [SAR202 cluster bacterium Io17-Chloro-G2]|nr:MAG: hypothetical protein BZY80_02435 [SAR202 cluster bacterium Io17-Chloro-G2]